VIGWVFETQTNKTNKIGEKKQKAVSVFLGKNMITMPRGVNNFPDSGT